MPMETSSVTSNVESIQTPKSSNTLQVNRQESSAANPFAPQTNVLLKNAIGNMKSILNNAAEVQDLQENALPEQVQKMVQNILEKSFSLENTLAEGISSTVESQRFSADSLTSLARMLTQLSAAAEKGNSLELNESLQALLKNIKEYTTTQDDSFEPVMLHKLAFQILDGKDTSEISQFLQSVLQQPAAGSNLTENTNEQGSTLLKQLMKAFLPTRINTWAATNANTQAEQGRPETSAATGQATPNPVEENSAPAQTPAQNTEQSAAKGDAPAQQPKTAASPQPSEGAPESTKESLLATNDKSQTFTSKDNLPEQASAQSKTTQTSDEAAQLKDNRQVNNPLPSADKSSVPETTQPKTGQENPEQNRQFQQGNNNHAELNRGNGEILRFKSSVPTTENGNSQAGYAPSGKLENSASTTTTMKNLADLLLKDAALSEKDTALLQNFINGKNTTLEEKEAKQLQLLLKLCENNIPASVKQAASQQPELKDLPKLWAFMELCDVASLKEKKAVRLKKAARTVGMFANSLKSSLTASESSNTEKGKSLSFTMPLYMGEGEKTKYPAYIHIYHDTRDDDAAGITRQNHDTWLRICCLTENIGAVELTCHLYDESKVDVALTFSQENASREFREYIPEFKAFMQDSSLSLNSFKLKS